MYPNGHGRHRKGATMLYGVDRAWDCGMCLVTILALRGLGRRCRRQRRLLRTAHDSTDRVKSPSAQAAGRDRAGRVRHHGQAAGHRGIAMSRPRPLEAGPCRRYGVASLLSGASVAASCRILSLATRDCHGCGSAPSCKGPARTVECPVCYGCCDAPTLLPHILLMCCRERRGGYRKLANIQVHASEGELK